jgi:hypothetical protein
MIIFFISSVDCENGNSDKTDLDKVIGKNTQTISGDWLILQKEILY